MVYNFFQLFKNISRFLLVVPVLIPLLIGFLYSPEVLALDKGEDLFIMHCSGCHVNGGNIIRRSKNLKLSTLKRKGLDNPDAIASIARDGIGSMSGYKEVLEKGGDQLVAIWIWNQAQNAWIHG